VTFHRTPLRRRLPRTGAVAAALPLILLGAGVAASTAGPVTLAASGTHGVSSAWASNLWLGSASSGTGTTLADVRTSIGASTGTTSSLTGAGVGVALIDTGVAPVDGLPAARVVNGPDLSIESQSSSLRYLDTYGHGTHMAGIIVGNDTATGTKGLAYGAKLTSVKVGTASGAVDVTQMIAAIDWVVAHRNDDPANPIRVINLSYGTGGNPTSWTDPVQYAVEQAWLKGIVVVAAAGNGGNNDLSVSDPGNDPYVIAVGAADTKGTTNAGDDDLASFASLGGGTGRNLDILAPGQSIVSLANPGSNVDLSYPAARVGTTLFRGSGSSQAAAVTSAAVALLLQARPSLTPDQVKATLSGSGTYTSGLSGQRGIREINLAAALTYTTTATQTWMKSAGTGKLEDARGPSHVVHDNVSLIGEKCVWGALNTSTWAPKSGTQTAWSGGVWMGYRLAGDGWTGTSWASKTWAAATWVGNGWDGTAWTDPSWTGHYWSGHYWSGGTWSGHYWSSDDWSASYWG
jgi:serine protease AprX